MPNTSARPSGWNSAAAISPSTPSALLTAIVNGFDSRRKRSAIRTSSAVSPALWSTTRTTAFASSIARSTCSATSAVIVARVAGREAARVDHDEAPLGVRADAVAPIASETREVRDERVARAGQPVEERGFADVGTADEGHCGQHGSTVRGAALGRVGPHGERGDRAVVTLHVDVLADRERRAADPIAGRALAREEMAVRRVEPMQIAFEVADDDARCRSA